MYICIFINEFASFLGKYKILFLIYIDKCRKDHSFADVTQSN